jgi:hypothetical protein
MTAIAPRATPHVGIFWLVQTTDGEARLLATGCPLDQTEPYGDCLTYSRGHYETWEHWRRDRTVDPTLRALLLSYEYEDWPRGRIVFDRARDRFILYADRKLMTPATIARIKTQFRLPADRTEVQSDLHYQSTETPNELDTWGEYSQQTWLCQIRTLTRCPAPPRLSPPVPLLSRPSPAQGNRRTIPRTHGQS